MFGALLENARFFKAEIIYSFITKEEKMKKFWLILLSLGLVMAFSVSAFAVEVKVSGEYFAAGLYLNKVTVDNGFERWQGNRGSEQPSTAFFYQRMQVGTDFIVSPSLKLVTRFNAMERIWGGARTDADTDVNAGGTSAGTRAENENITFDLIYIDYTSPIGQFKVGYQPDYVFGTIFADRAAGIPAGQIQYYIQKGPFTGLIGYAKETDNSWSAVSAGTTINATRTDRDLDSYRVAGIYNFKGGEAGALLLFNRDATCRGRACDSYLSNVYVFDPYVKAQIGPVALQAEAQYWFGDARKYEGYVTGESNVSVGALSIFVDATATFGMFNVGGSVAYLSGDDPGTTDKIEGGINTAGVDWNPCLILFNQDLNFWVGANMWGHSNTLVDSEMSNAWFGQLRAGVKPTPQLDVMLSVAYAQVDKKPSGISGGTYGTEVDLTGTYKITNNLSYMLGVGYLFTGDYFKGYNYDFGAGSSKVNDDYILMNKLTLSF
jgi:hypothetical protein